MPSYRVDIATTGLAGSLDALDRLAQALDQIGTFQRNIAQVRVTPNLNDKQVDRLERLAKAYDSLGTAMRGIPTAPSVVAPGRGGGGGGGTGGNGGGGTGQKDPSFITGPEQRLLRIADQLQRAATLSDPVKQRAVVSDLLRSQWLAQRQIVLDQRRRNDPNALRAKGLLELFQDLNRLMGSLRQGNLGAIVATVGRMSSRTAVGGGAAGAAGAAAGAAGGAGGADAMASLAAIGRIGLAIAAVVVIVKLLQAAFNVAVSAVRAFVNGLRSAAEALRATRQAMLLSGGTTGQISRLQSMGLDAGSIPGLAAAVTAAISVGGNPFAMAAAQQAGISTRLGRPFGPVNEAKVLEQVAQFLGTLSGEARIRAARLFNAEALLPTLDVSRNVQQARGRSAFMGELLATPQAMRGANDFAAAIQLIGRNFGLALQAFNATALPPITEGLLAFGDALLDVASTFSAHPELGATIGNIGKMILKVAAEVVRWIPKLILGFGKMIEDIANYIIMLINIAKLLNPLSDKDFIAPVKIFDPKSVDPLNDALNKNTQATDKLAGVIQQGLHGGGARARGALPGSLRGLLLQQALAGDGQILRRGAFAL